MGDLDREAKIKKEAEEKRRTEEAEAEIRRSLEDKQHREEQEQREREQAQQQQEQKPVEEGEKKADDKDGEEEGDKGEEKQLRKRSSSDEDFSGLEPRAEAPQQQQQQQQPVQPATVPPPSVKEEPPQQYTLCSPQLLHLDTDGTPLWFNGWLLANKFADKRQKKFGSFKHYLIEPEEIEEPGAWQLHENNECCLTVEKDRMRKFTAEELALLDRMMKKAREVGAPGS
jgi:hypothetical protein